VLLHLCASVGSLKTKVTAVYINHGLQKDAEKWALHCSKISEKLNVTFLSLKVNAQPNHRESPEEAARNARYAALKSLVGTNEIILLAQHQEDQFETVLLQLFRGSGLRGLSGMPACIDFGSGLLLRPLLNVPKQEIIQYAETQKLKWIDDPSNGCDDFDRNFLRNQIAPLIKQRWPSVDKTVARSAQHCANANLLITELINDRFDQFYNPKRKSLDLTRLSTLNEIQKASILRHWFAALGLRPPSQALLQAMIDQLIGAEPDSCLSIDNQGHVFKRFQQTLFCLPSSFFKKETVPKIWPQHEQTIAMVNGFSLIRTPSSSGISQELWQASNVTILYRRGGEKIKLPGRNHHQTLKNLYQQSHIPPWERNIRPLIFLNNQLAAVAGLWIDDWAWAETPDNCIQISWEPTINYYI
jgi:tRNA(Ile)-lysidine synthase